MSTRRVQVLYESSGSCCTRDGFVHLDARGSALHPRRAHFRARTNAGDGSSAVLGTVPTTDVPTTRSCRDIGGSVMGQESRVHATASFLRSACDTAAHQTHRRHGIHDSAGADAADDVRGEEVHGPGRSAADRPSTVCGTRSGHHGRGHRPGDQHERLGSTGAVGRGARRRFRPRIVHLPVRIPRRIPRHAVDSASGADADHRPDPRCAGTGWSVAATRNVAEHRDVRRTSTCHVGRDRRVPIG